MLIRIRIQDLKKFVTDPDPQQILKRIRIQVKTTDPDPGKKRINYDFSINNHLN